ncbi:hypothetical protein [Companilactobacillus sp.]|uniref:hypothetical protein n=1 Tax=Companilactobacillus sp. TaxID=2767905 RepID=UPI0026382860|nr:hypothetical protein [Companilactobacillus sp.]
MKNTLPIALQFSLLLFIFTANITKSFQMIKSPQRIVKLVTERETIPYEIEHGRTLKNDQKAHRKSDQ